MLLLIGFVGAVVVGRHRAASAVPIAPPAPPRPVVPPPVPAAAPAAAAPEQAEPVPVAEPAAVAEPAEAVEVVLFEDAPHAAGEQGPYPGSALPLADGSAPSGEYTVKAKDATKRCHGPQSPYFKRTRADLWFRAEADAEAAGFIPWRPTRS